jgi:spore coat polysaccharide biosynthesis predicted glycosyltransferase SpsG
VRIAVRADAFGVIGTGHGRRCLSLAEALRQASAHVEFITRSLGADPVTKIQAARFPHVQGGTTRAKRAFETAGYAFKGEVGSKKL